MNYNRTGRALRYILFSRHRRGHGIHSPFVFDLINMVLLRKIPADVMPGINAVRKRLESSKLLIDVNDLGSGSDYMSSTFRRISDITRRSSVSNSYGRILYNLAQRYNGKAILEMGTSLGVSTLFMAMGAPGSEITSIEGCPGLAERARHNLSGCNIENVTVLAGSFDEKLRAIMANDLSPAMVFVDGDHRKEAVLRYFSILKELIAPDSVIIFDDINYSRGMSEAWHEIKSDLQVSVSIDIFRMGMVFFREGMVKQDFVIRY